MCNGAGEPVTLPNAICLHEEDAGLLWKHWDFRTGETEVRRSRRLVISFITTIGNYDYGFYWMLYLDGTIELEIKLTGIVATGAIQPGEQPAHGTLIAEGLYAMNHQHFFNARLDFDLDGERNAVYEVHTEASPAGPGNPVGSAFAGVRTLLRSEAEAPQADRPALLARLGRRQPRAHERDRRAGRLPPRAGRELPAVRARTTRSSRKRAGFCFKHVWVTRFHADERYAAGEYPNLHAGGAGLPEFVADDEGIVDEDIVLWYSLGHNHLPAHRGLADHAGLEDGLHAQAERLLRPQPHARRPASALEPLLLPRQRSRRIASARAQLEAGLRGRLVAEGEPGYDEARAVWNADIDRRPALVAQCAGVSDVALCVRTAREHDLTLAVRGGSHNVAGFGTCDGGLVCDLGALRAVRVDPSRRSATVQGGATWADFDAETQAFGLATTGGVVISTGVGGLTLGGGIGWLKRNYGLTCDNLLGADVLTADGTLVRASRDENPDLFRALRGGGGNFGIVTSFDFALHEVDTVVGGYLALRDRAARRAAALVPRGRARLPARAHDAALHHVRRRRGADPGAALGQARDPARRVLERRSARGRARPGAVARRGARDRRRARAAALPRAAGRVRRRPAGAARATATTGRRSTSRALPDAAIDAFCEHAGRATSPISYMEIDPLGGAISEVGEDETAIGFRDAPFLYQSNAVWTADDPERERHVAWARDFFAAMAPFSAGATYLNFIGEEGGERVRGAFTPALWDALTATKRRFDPENLFRVNQNIAP